MRVPILMCSVIAMIVVGLPASPGSAQSVLGDPVDRCLGVPELDIVDGELFVPEILPEDRDGLLIACEQAIKRRPNDPELLHRLAVLKLEEPGDVALELLRQAADAGHLASQRLFGFIYLPMRDKRDPEDVERDYQLAQHYLELASRQGDGEAAYWLALTDVQLLMWRARTPWQEWVVNRRCGMRPDMPDVERFKLFAKCPQILYRRALKRIFDALHNGSQKAKGLLGSIYVIAFQGAVRLDEMAPLGTEIPVKDLLQMAEEGAEAGDQLALAILPMEYSSDYSLLGAKKSYAKYEYWLLKAAKSQKIARLQLIHLYLKGSVFFGPEGEVEPDLGRAQQVLCTKDFKSLQSVIDKVSGIRHFCNSRL